MSFPSRPATPANLITNVNYNEPPHLTAAGNYHSELRSPLEETPNQHEDQDQLETMIHNVLQNIGQTDYTLNPKEVQSLLEKCLVTLSNYKFQKRLLLFENNELSKRNEIETDLIKSQVDCLLLKSPFRPTSPSSSVSNSPPPTSSRTLFSNANYTPSSPPYYDNELEEDNICSKLSFTPHLTPRTRKSLKKSLKPSTNPKPSRPQLKLVERLANNTNAAAKDSNDYKNCIKVFHLEKSTKK